MTAMQTEFKVGDLVEKINGYRFPGEVVAVFKNRVGETRLVVECTVAGIEGMLHIFNPSQMRKIT